MTEDTIKVRMGMFKFTKLGRTNDDPTAPLDEEWDMYMRPHAVWSVHEARLGDVKSMPGVEVGHVGSWINAGGQLHRALEPVDEILSLMEAVAAAEISSCGHDDMPTMQVEIVKARGLFYAFMAILAVIVLVLFTGCSPFTTVCESTYPETWTPTTWQDSCTGPDPLDMPDLGDYVITLEVGDGPGRVEHATTWVQGHNPFTTSTDGSDYELITGDFPDSACGGFNGLHDRRFVDMMTQGAHGGYSRITDVDAGDGPGCWWYQVVPLTLYQGVDGYLDGYDGGGAFGWHQWQVLTVEAI